jgi:hypothetical protein
MTLGATDISNRSAVDVRRETLALHEEKLAAAQKQRDVILIDKRVASAAVDKGDQRARAEVARLGKQDLELGRLVISLERQVREARRWLTFAEDQGAGAAAWQARTDDAALVRDKLFELAAPDGRKLRHRHASAEALSRSLQPGYSIVGQVHGASDDGLGGFVAGANSNMMKVLLEAYGSDLLAWLPEQGIVGSDKTVVVLPSNGREKMQ